MSKQRLLKIRRKVKLSGKTEMSVFVWFLLPPCMFFLAAWAARGRGGWMLIMQMSEDVCVKILCGNISEFIELFTRLLVYYFGDLSFDVHTFLKYLFSEWNLDVWSRGEIMNLGINIEQLFCVTRSFVWKSNLKQPLVSNVTNLFVTQYFDWTLNKSIALTIHQQYLGQSLKLLSNLSKKCYLVWKYFFSNERLV